MFQIMDQSRREQWLLKVSIFATIALSISSIVFGLSLGSKSLTFDGIYESIDAAMTAIALITVKLIARGDDKRFQYGYWHFEPMLAMVNGLILAFACLYAVLDGINGLTAGGRHTEFGGGAIFAAVTGLVSLGLYLYIRRASRTLDSQLLDVDARGWLIGAVLSAGLCIGFIAGEALMRAGAVTYAPLIDPLILLVVAACLIPFPLSTIWHSGRQVLQIAPNDLDQQVRKVAADVAARHGFSEFSSHVAVVGRQQFIEIGFVAGAPDDAMSFAQLDRIRQEIGDAMGGLNPGCWLTVDFTADERWI